MREEDLDSSVNEYEEEYKSSSYIKQLEWDMAIVLQQVDNLKPSKYLEKLYKDNINGNITIDEVKNNLKEYYDNNKSKINYKELECDFVSTRIVE